MIDFFRELYMDRFWSDWSEKFMSNTSKWITPNDEKVTEFSDNIPIPAGANDEQVIKEVWLHITNNIDYRLTAKWQEPRELLESGVGDCEDVVFLFLSTLPNIDDGFEPDMIIGYLEKPTGEGGPHVWVEVEGMTVDPTGYPSDVEKIMYEEVNSFDIEYNNA